MKIINHLILTLIAASVSVRNKFRARTQRVDRLTAERGSVTLEQIIWTVALAIVAIAIVAIVVAAINAKAGQLPF